MRNSGKRRSISLVVTIVAGATLALTVASNRGESALGSWFTIAVITSFFTVGAAIATMVFHFNHRLRQRLIAGHRQLARWTLSPAEWQQFVTDEARRKAEGRHNNFKAASTPADTGVDVFVAENAIMIDGDFYHLGYMRGLQWIPDELPCLEYNMVTSGKSGSVRWNVRFPVAPGAEPLARKIWDYVHPPVQPGTEDKEARRLDRIRKFGLIAGIAFLPLMLYGIFILRAGSRETSTLVALIVGLMGFAIGLLSFLLGHFLYRAELKRLRRAAVSVASTS